MSQLDTLRRLDAAILGPIKRAGISDVPVFRAKGVVPPAPGTPCDAYIDRDVRLYGDDEAEVATLHTTVTVFFAQVDPHRGATLTLGDETFKFEAEVSHDESSALWAVVKA
jgi:hypothetical protein